MSDNLSPERFPWLTEHACDPPPTEGQISPPPANWEAICDEADVMTARLGALHRPTEPFPADPKSQPAVPSEVHLFTGSAAWALAGVRGLLHKYLAEVGKPDDREALLMQGILIGGSLATQAGASALFKAGYRP